MYFLDFIECRLGRRLAAFSFLHSNNDFRSVYSLRNMLKGKICLYIINPYSHRCSFLITIMDLLEAHVKILRSSSMAWPKGHCWHAIILPCLLLFPMDIYCTASNNSKAHIHFSYVKFFPIVKNLLLYVHHAQIQGHSRINEITSNNMLLLSHFCCCFEHAFCMIFIISKAHKFIQILFTSPFLHFVNFAAGYMWQLTLKFSLVWNYFPIQFDAYNLSS